MKTMISINLKIKYIIMIVILKLFEYKSMEINVTNSKGFQSKDK